MGEPATIQTATSTQEFEVHVNPLSGKYPVHVHPRNIQCKAEKCWWKKQAGSKAFKFKGFTAHPHPQYGIPFRLETLKITDDEIECEFDGSVAPPDTKFEYTIQAEFTDIYTSDKPEPQITPTLMMPGDDKAVIRN